MSLQHFFKIMCMFRNIWIDVSVQITTISVSFNRHLFVSLRLKAWLKERVAQKIALSNGLRGDLTREEESFLKVILFQELK